ncbi:MAG: ATP-binding protein [Bdellovibrionales bacterium]|nr:ATP-binding protein [Bdellovibrionales bacterium]
MRIIINDIKHSEFSELIKDPSLQQAIKFWGKDAYNEKSAIDLRLFDTPNGSISILYGPRQIGKTSSLKWFLTTVKDYDTLIYLDCSTYLEKQDLYNSLREQISGASTIVLDEVQSVPEWHLALRKLYSEGMLEKCRVWCTGSEARYLLESGERLPGRKGEGKVVFAKPWSFKRFLNLFYPKDVQQLQDINFLHINQKWLNDQNLDLSKQWQEYKLVGGIPQSIGEHFTTDAISDLTFTVYIDWILGTWSKLRTSERSLRKLASRICETLNSRVSYEALSKGTDIASPNTVKSLIEIQEDSFSLRICPKLDLHDKLSAPAKLKKVYPIDPFIALVWGLISDKILRNHQKNLPDLKLDEAAFFTQTYRYENQLDVSYLYSSKTKAEVDFYFKGCGFELKSKGKPTAAQNKLLAECNQQFVVKQEKLPIVAYLVGEE